MSIQLKLTATVPAANADELCELIRSAGGDVELVAIVNDNTRQRKILPKSVRREIAKAYTEGRPAAALASAYGVSTATIYRAARKP